MDAYHECQSFKEASAAVAMSAHTQCISLPIEIVSLMADGRREWEEAQHSLPHYVCDGKHSWLLLLQNKDSRLCVFLYSLRFRWRVNKG